MKKKWLKKGGALLMAATMLLSVFSGTMGTGITAYAAENQTPTADGSTTVKLAVQEAEEASSNTPTDLSSVSGNSSYVHEITNGGSYYLSSDLTSNEYKTFLHITGDIDVTIDLKGHSICSNYTGITIDDNARVTITNSSNEESKIDYGTDSGIGVLINQNGGSLTLENVTLVEKQGSSYDYPLVRVNNDGKLTVKNVKFDSEGFCINLKQTGDINIADSTFTVNNSSLDGGGNIIYTDYNYTIGNITVTDSTFTWDKNDGISITTPDHGSVNISGSTFNCSSGISVKGGEVNVSGCKFEGTDEYSLGYAVYMTSVADKENKLTVSGGTCNTRYGGIGVKSAAAKVDVTLKGDIAFGKTTELGDLVFLTEYSSQAQVDLHMDELTTQNLTMSVPSTEYEGAITCDADYSAKLKARDTKYAVHCEETNGKYVVKFNERKITTQPTVESPKVEVSDDTGVSFQWYKAGEKAYELNDTGIEGVLVPEENYYSIGNYENGVWKPVDMSSGPMALAAEDMYGVIFELGDFKGNCTVVIENKKGSLEEYREYFGVRDEENYEPFEPEVKDGKLYFSGKADGLSIYGMGIPQDAELIVKVIVPNDTEALQGQNTNTLTVAQPGDYRCHVIWDAGTDYSYEILSDTLTISQAIEPDEPGEEPADPTPDPTPDPDTDEILVLAKTNVTSKIEKLSVSNLTTDKDIINAIKTELQLLNNDESNKVESEITVKKTEAKVETAGQIAITVKLSLNGKNITFDLNKTITALVGKNITVTVQDDGKQPISDAEVKVMLGNTEKVKGKSSSAGICTFNNLPSGLYNVVVAKAGVTKTAIADLTKNNAGVTVVLDTNSKGSSHLVVVSGNKTESGTQKPAVKVEETVVKNLDVLTDKHKETVSYGESYKVEMAVEAKTDKEIATATQNKMVKEANKGEDAKATNIDYLDISITKTITKSSGSTESKITDTGDIVIEIIIPFNFTGKKNIRVLREHDGVVKKFDKNNTGKDGTYKIDTENGLITLYATNFSTYAVSYVAEGETAIPEPPSYSGGGGYTSVPATEITVETDKIELTKAGETAAVQATVQPTYATDKSLIFTSSDEKVAKVDANGVITAVGNGTATITIKTANGITKTITITVNIPTDENKDDENKDNGNKDDTNKDDANKDDGNQDDGNKDGSSSTEEESVTPAKVVANTIAINKGLKVSQTGNKINVSWGKVADADGYLVYATYCGTNFGKAVKTIQDPSSVSTTITKLNGKKLDLKKNFKVYVKAYKLVDGKKVAFGNSLIAHIAGTKHAKNTNVKAVKFTSKSKLTLAVGKTSKIKAKVVLVDAAKKQLSDGHAAQFRYASSNKKVATVDKNGKITAKAKGTCYIYVYAKNGYAKKVTVTVK